jgi:hypothetical protein
MNVSQRSQAVCTRDVQFVDDEADSSNVENFGPSRAAGRKNTPVAAARERGSVSMFAALLAAGVAGEQHCIATVGLLRSIPRAKK